MFAQTPIWLLSHSTDLADAYSLHLTSFRGQSKYALCGVETDWLNVLRDRATRQNEQLLLKLTARLLALLKSPTACKDFRKRFDITYEKAWRSAYPISHKLIKEHHVHRDITVDYTLSCFDLGQVRAIEDDALTDNSVKTFAREMLKKLTAKTKSPRHEVYRSVFETYSEALIFLLLRERAGKSLKIEKIAETAEAGPDFKCELLTERNGQTQCLTFYIEVKSLDIVDATQRLPQMLDEGMDAQIELNRQFAEGRPVAIAEREIAPHRGYGDTPGYDHHSVKAVIENIIKKATGNFKNTQFRRGPTFALVNLLRLPLPGQGTGALAPFYYDPRMGGACVSGVLWHVAFGEVGASIHKMPDFEGAGTFDGTLQRTGILLDQSLLLGTPGLIVFHYEQSSYRFDAFYDTRWKSNEWCNIQTEEVIVALCADYNTRTNESAHEYAHYRDRTAK
jgi:hypothetical protein